MPFPTQSIREVARQILHQRIRRGSPSNHRTRPPIYVSPTVMHGNNNLLGTCTRRHERIHYTKCNGTWLLVRRYYYEVPLLVRATTQCLLHEYFKHVARPDKRSVSGPPKYHSACGMIQIRPNVFRTQVAQRRPSCNYASRACKDTFYKSTDVREKKSSFLDCESSALEPICQSQRE